MRRAYRLVCNVKKHVKSKAEAAPEPKAAIAAFVTEVLQNVVGGLASFTPNTMMLFALVYAPVQPKSHTSTSVYTICV